MYRVLRENGIVSVFLVIILVPCIVASSLFVDLSRVRLAKAAAESAADLALNSLLSNYDAELAQLYGLMASCQTIDEFYSETEEFFKTAMQSRGLTTEEIDTLYGLATHAMDGAETSDLLAMEVNPAEDGTKIIDAVPNSALDNPVIIEDQVVEFMKYRAPIELTTGIIDRIKKSGAQEAFGESDDSKDLQDAKEDFADAADDLSRQLYLLSNAIRDYESLTPTLTHLNIISDDLIKYRKLYKEINEKIITNLYQTSGLTTFSRYTCTLTNWVNTYKLGSNEFKNVKNKLYSSKIENEDGTTTYIINKEYMEALAESLNNKIEVFKDTKSDLVNVVTKNTIDLSVGTGDNQYSEIYWWKDVNAKINKTNPQYNKTYIYAFEVAAKDMLIAYAKLLAATTCEIDEAYKAEWELTDEKECNTLLNTVSSLQGQYLRKNATVGTDYYLKLVDRLEKVSANNITKINSSTLTLSNGKTIGSTVSSISTTLENYKTKNQEYIDAINYIIDGDPGIFGTGINADYKGIDSLVSLVKKYDEKLDDWEAKANSTDTLMAEEDKKDIPNFRGENEQFGSVNEKSIEELKTRLINIRTQFENANTKIDELTYGGKELTKITTYNEVYNCIKDYITIPSSKTNSSLKNYATTLFKANFVVYSSNSDAKILTVNQEDAHNPDLNKGRPELYQFLKNEYKGKVGKEKEDKIDEIDEKEKENEDNENKEDTGDRTSGISKTNINGNKEYVAANFPSGFSQEAFSLGEGFISGLSGIIKTLVSGDFTTMRDNLYLTEYCMSMFSYATLVNEGKRDLWQEQNTNSSLSYKNRNSTYLASNITGDKDTRGTWLSVSPFDTYNQSLTNVKFNDTNNVAFGSEVEYVLYGGTNEENVKDAYSDIYAIRFTLNLVSGMCYFWSTSNTTGQLINTIASGISSATGGIVPAVLVKVVIITMLAVLESDHDLDVLQSGLSVPVLKNEKQWCYAMKGANSKSFDDNSASNKDAGVNDPGLYYSDYMYLFLLLGFQSSKSELCLRLADVVQANMMQYLAKNDYSLKKSFVYFQINADIKVKPLMLDLSYAENYSNNPKNNDTLFSFKINEKRGYS